jgi:glycosyltransferase involved in cell wall biosynthesis
MRIMFFLHYPNPFPEAAWRRIEFFAEYFQKKGHKVTIVGAFSYMTIRKAGSTRLNGIRLLNITPIIMMTNIISLTFNTISSLLSCFIPFIMVRPDIVIISVPVGETALGPFVGTKLFRTKRVVLDYRDEWEDFALKMAKSRIYKKACQSLKGIMTKFYSKIYLIMATTGPIAAGLSSRGLENVKIVTNGADTQIFKPYDKDCVRNKIGIDKGDFIIVYSGIFGAYYRLDVVIKALEKIIERKYNVKFLMIGQGDVEIEKIMRLARKKGLESNVIYLGAKSDRMQIAEILSASDVGIIPYDSNSLWKHTLPVKSLEYLACGLPIIATTYSDSVLGKLICENQVGMITDPENIESLVTIIERMYNDKLFLKNAGKRALCLIQDYFDRNKITEDLYHELIESMPQ